jgi:hypothetical protein
MSVKQQLAQAVDSLPESITVEEAFERLDRAFKLRHGTAAAPPSAALGLKEMLRAMPDVGSDDDFERTADMGRGDPSWAT